MLYGLPPIIACTSRILILGTLPGTLSLAKKQYYAHPGNRFWPLFFHAIDEPLPETYPTRCRRLLARGFALWDVLTAAEREGAMDQNICHAVPNDFVAFFKSYPEIHTVLFTSKNAEKYFLSFFPLFHRRLTTGVLYSPSGAFGRSFEEKKQQWINTFSNII